MQLEAVIICKDYSDFLEFTLPENLQHLDHVVVVTSPQDKSTKDICSKYGVECLDTEMFHERGDKFNKARAINYGLAHLRHDDWLIHIDADILLPHRFKYMLSHARLKKDVIYGADRFNIGSYQKYSEVKADLVPQWRHGFLVYPPRGLHIGARYFHGHYGWLPIGYFQLWHGSQQRKYPINQGSCEHTDVLFSLQWPRERRSLLPEIFVYHLESQGAEFGSNWHGRKTKPFKPCPPPYEK